MAVCSCATAIARPRLHLGSFTTGQPKNSRSIMISAAEGGSFDLRRTHRQSPRHILAQSTTTGEHLPFDRFLFFRHCRENPYRTRRATSLRPSHRGEGSEQPRRGSVRTEERRDVARFREVPLWSDGVITSCGPLWALERRLRV